MINLTCCSKDMKSRNYERKLYNFEQFDFENFFKYLNSPNDVMKSQIRWS